MITALATVAMQLIIAAAAKTSSKVIRKSSRFSRFQQAGLSSGDAAFEIRHFQYTDYSVFYYYCIYVKGDIVIVLK